MRRSFVFFLLGVIGLFLGSPYAQDNDSIVAAVSLPDSHDVVAPDTARLLTAPLTDSLFSDTCRSPAVVPRQSQKLTLIKRKYNSRQQVVLATGMMIFVVGIMTMAQQWNPR